MAINIIKLQRYNFNFFKLEEIILFEYLIVKAISFKKEFYHSSATIEEETGIKRGKLDSILQNFCTLGFISIDVRSFPKVKYFTVNFHWILENLNNIYNQKNLADDEFVELAKNFFQLNNPENRNKKNKVGQINDPTFLQFVGNFDMWLEEIKKRHGIKKKLEYDTNELKNLYNCYDEETIKNFLLKYFREKGMFGKLSDFFKFDLHSLKNILIEQKKIQEKIEIEELIEQLNDKYNQMRSQYSRGSLPYTSLPLSEGILSKLAKLLTQYNSDHIINAFEAYTLAILQGDISPNNTLEYFLYMNRRDFPVFNRHLEKFNLEFEEDEDDS